MRPGRIKHLKATLICRNQEIKRLKKLLRQTKEIHKSVLSDYHKEIILLQKRVEELTIKLAKSQTRKWYEFKLISD